MAYTGPHGAFHLNPRTQATMPGGDAGSTRHVWQGPGGSTIIHGGMHGDYTGPRGNEIAGGKSGTVVIGPNGNIHSSASRGAAVKTPGGEVIAGGSHYGKTTGPGGTTAHGGSIRAARGPGGAEIAGRHGAIAVGPHGAVAAGGRYYGRVGPGGSAFVGTRFVAGSTLAGQGAYVRRNFGYYNAFTPAWYARYPGAWFAAGWAAGAVWRAATWGIAAATCGYSDDTSPIDYSYGDTVTYQDGNVVYGDQIASTEADYADQATAIADAGAKTDPPVDDKWEPLGIFAMVKGDETTSNDIFQLAMNKDGVIRGNYYNATTDSTTPVKGSLDRKSQRVAWTIGDNKATVFEVGLYNLTKDETTMLVHFGKDSTEQRTLVRIEQPKDGEAKAGQQ
jgi:hypothetical protein